MYLFLLKNKDISSSAKCVSFTIIFHVIVSGIANIISKSQRGLVGP